MQPCFEQLNQIVDDEQFVLCELLLGCVDFDVVAKIIDHSAFLDPWHRVIFEIMESLNCNDMVIGAGEVFRQADPDDIGDAIYLADIMRAQNDTVCNMLDFGLQPALIETYCQRIKLRAAVFAKQ